LQRDKEGWINSWTNTPVQFHLERKTSDYNKKAKELLIAKSIHLALAFKIKKFWQNRFKIISMVSQYASKDKARNYRNVPRRTKEILTSTKALSTLFPVIKITDTFIKRVKFERNYSEKVSKV